MIRVRPLLLPLCLLPLLAACGTPPPAGPGPAPLIRAGETVRGRLEPVDRRAFGRGPLRTYSFQAREGQRLVATVRGGFDSHLMVARMGPVPDSAGGGVLFEDAGPVLRFTVPAAGTYLLVAQAASADGHGAFELTLREAPPATTGGVRAIAVGDRVRGELAETDESERVGTETVFYDAYRFTGRAGERVEIEMDSDSFDTVVTLGRVRGGEYAAIEENDDGSSNRTGSLLMYVLPEDGEYVVRATSYGEGLGPYLLHLRRWEDAPVMTLYAGQAEEGTLEPADRVSEGAFHDAFHYQGRAGERVRIVMESEDFDAALVLGRMRGGEFQPVARIDDGGQGTDARLELALPEDGEYVIRATSFGARQTGAYRILLTSLPR